MKLLYVRRQWVLLLYANTIEFFVGVLATTLPMMRLPPRSTFGRTISFYFYVPHKWIFSVQKHIEWHVSGELIIIW